MKHLNLNEAFPFAASATPAGGSAPPPLDPLRQAGREAICDAFGVTVEEVEALDRHMHGPEERARRAAAEQFFQDEKRRVMAEVSRRFIHKLLYGTDP